MSLPACAWCGGSVVRRSRTVVRWSRLPGRPTVAWCDDLGCADSDPYWRWMHESRLGPAAIVRGIAERGADRVSAGAAWSRYERDLPEEKVLVPDRAEC